MDLIAVPPSLQAATALGIVAVMFVAFLRESFPAEVVALSGAAAMLALGILPYEAALGVLSNPAPWTIGAMFIVMGALVRTGALAAFTGLAEAQAETHPKRALAGLMLFVVLASAIVSNTPVVVVMIPVFVALGRKLGLAASKLLIPLSYGAILGGTLTLIGTSTNLLVDGVARAEGLAPFTIFEVTPLAVILVAWGMVYLGLIAPRLLPERASMASLLGTASSRKFLTEVVVPPGSPLIGQVAPEVAMFRRKGVRLVDVVRRGRSLRHDLSAVRLEAGDHVVLRTQMEELLSLQEDQALRPVSQISTVETTTVEVLVGPGSRMIGRSFAALGLRRRYGVYPLAVHRRDKNIAARLDTVTLELGDTILLEGAPEELARLAREMNLTGITQPAARAYRRSHAPIALAVLLALVGFAALGVAPIFALAVLAVALVLVTRCIDADEAFGFVDGRLLVLIFSMLAIGAGLEASGAVRLIAETFAPWLAGLPPFWVVWAIYLLTSLLTELVSNNAVAVVVTPIAIGLGHEMGLEPRGLVVAVMVAASASFATPIGYQTNMLVYGPGGYRFTDFLRAGLPLNLSIGLIASLLIPYFWPL